MPVVFVASVESITQVELNYLATLRPDDGHSGYKFVYRSRHKALRWRVRIRIGRKLHNPGGLFISPREAAKAAVRFLRSRYGREWMGRLMWSGREGNFPRWDAVSSPRPNENWHDEGD